MFFKITSWRAYIRNATIMAEKRVKAERRATRPGCTR